MPSRLAALESNHPMPRALLPLPESEALKKKHGVNYGYMERDRQKRHLPARPKLLDHPPQALSPHRCMHGKYFLLELATTNIVRGLTSPLSASSFRGTVFG